MKRTTKQVDKNFYLANPSSVINRHFESVMELQCLQIRFYATCVNEPMFLRPYPVYIKM